MISTQLGAYIQSIKSLQDLELKSTPLGEGAYGEVWRVDIPKDIPKLKSENMALKLIRRNPANGPLIEHEANILSQLVHPRICLMYSVVYQYDKCGFLMELMPGMDLEKYRGLNRRQLKEKEVKKIVAQVIEALIYIHGKRIVHLDLKPANMVYNRKTGIVKLVDFGIAKIITSVGYLKGTCGTKGYVAPEVWGNKYYNYKADIWGLGMTAYVLMCKVEETHVYHYSTKCFRNGLWKGFHRNAYEFISQALTVNQFDRMSAVVASHHPWISKKVVHWKSEVKKEPDETDRLVKINNNRVSDRNQRIMNNLLNTEFKK